MLSERSSSLAVTPLTLRTMLTRDLASRAIRYIRQEAPRRECDPPFRPHCNGLIDGRCCRLVPAAIFWFTSITSSRARDVDFRFALTSGSYRGRSEPSQWGQKRKREVSDVSGPTHGRLARLPHCFILSPLTDDLVQKYYERLNNIFVLRGKSPA